MARDFLADAERLAPEPNSRAVLDGRDKWARHFAAQALAAHSEFRVAIRTVNKQTAPGSRPDLGHLMAIATASTAAAVALTVPAEHVAGKIWDLTPEAGALNGEYIDWLAETLDRLGVNPADLHPWFDGADFTTPARINPNPDHEPDATCPCSFCVGWAEALCRDTPNLQTAGGAGR